ncbi:MAG: glycosyltransferase family 4 protein [Candidatus Aegiribacteria sp.]|nr:glycosyltransferase family 4 protein [Candidatus Aegiribacteria sp.]
MKAILIGPYLRFGGVSRYVKDLLSGSGEFELFDTARPEKEKIRSGTGYIEAFNTGFIRVLSGLCVTVRNILRFPFVLMRSEAEIVHICGVSFFPFWENAFYCTIGRLLGKRITLHYLGAFDQFYEPAGRIHKFLIRSVLRIPDRIMLLSEKVKNLVASFIAVEKLSVVPSSVDTSRFNATNRDFPAVPGEVRILFVGGLDPFRKGVYDLLDAVKLILPEAPSAKLVMTGGSSFDEVEDKWKRMDLDDNVEFLGWFDEIMLPSLYAFCDILALPSYNEGLPYVIIEALSSGLPIVASRVGGIPDVVSNGENGFIIEPGDIDALANRLLELVRNTELRISMSRNNRVKAVREYSLEHVLSELNRIFSSLQDDSLK